MRGAGGFDHELVEAMPALRARAISLLRGRPCEVDDLVQETVYRALRARDQFIPGTNLKAWLFTIMRNEFISAGRKASRLVCDPSDELARTVPAANDQHAALEAKDALSFLFVIRPAHAQVIAMAAAGDQIEEIAVKLGVPNGTVKSRISRGRADLETLLGGVPV